MQHLLRGTNVEKRTNGLDIALKTHDQWAMKTPAEHIIEICGGVQAVVAMTGVSASRVRRWTYPQDRGGTGGHVPAKHQSTLLKKATEAGLPLSPADFFPLSTQGHQLEMIKEHAS